MEKTTKRAQQAKKTRALIIKTGLQLFAEKGFRNTTVDEICAACGVAKGTFYHYFKTKFDLFAASTGDHVEQLSETFLISSPSDICTDIILILSSYVDLVERRSASVGRDVARHMMNKSDAGLTNYHQAQRVVDLVCQYLRQAIEVGMVSESISLDHIDAILSLYIKGLLVEWETVGSQDSMVDRCLYTAPTLVKSLIKPFILQPT